MHGREKGIHSLPLTHLFAAFLLTLTIFGNFVEAEAVSNLVPNEISNDTSDGDVPFVVKSQFDDDQTEDSTAERNEFPWMVRTQSFFLGRPYGQFCGATLISKQWLLTAAHCVRDEKDHDASFIMAYLGKHNIALNGEPGELDQPVIEARVHPEYSRTNSANDFALLKLNSEIATTYSPSIRPIELIPEIICKLIPFSCQTGAFVPGWNRDPGENNSTILQKVSLQGSCHLESGSPIICRIDESNYQIDLFSNPAACSFDPQSRICPVLSWIRSYVPLPEPTTTTIQRTTTVVPIPSTSNCGPVPRVQNGKIADGGSESGSLRLVICNGGFVNIGANIVVCVNGGWTPAGTCTSLARPTTSPKPNPLVTTQVPPITTQRMTTLALPQQVTCPHPSVGNGYFITIDAGTDVVNVGTQIECQCRPGYMLFGVGRSNCTERGTWEPACGVCVALPSTTSRKPTTTTTTTSIPTTSTSRTVRCLGKVPDIGSGHFVPDPLVMNTLGMRLNIACDDGFTLIGRGFTVCQNGGTWSLTGMCLISCGPLPKLENGVITIASNGMVAYLFCDSGFLLEGAQTITCSANGQWSQPGTCKTPVPAPTGCGSLPVFENGRYLDDDSSEIRPLQCNEGYQLSSGNDFVQCQVDGTWTEPGHCSRVTVETTTQETPNTCSSLALVGLVVNGYVSYGTSQVGVVRAVQCLDGYRLYGSPIITCQLDGTWSIPGECRAIGPVLTPTQKPTTTSTKPTTITTTKPMTTSTIPVPQRQTTLRIEAVRQSLQKELIQASASGNYTQVAKVLQYQNQIMVNYREPGRNCSCIICLSDATALHYALVCNASQATDIALLLANLGADVNARDSSDNITALHLAAANGNYRAALMLLNRGANINARTIGGWTALMYAAWDGNFDTAKLLIDRGIDITPRNVLGQAAVDIAAYFNNGAITDLILDHLLL